MTNTTQDVRPFRIDIPRDRLDDLAARLAATRWPDAGSWAPQRGTVPTGVLVSARDVTVRRWAERDHDIVHWTEPAEGGHFLAMEAPQTLVDDVRVFFRKLR
jgi:pimeloyl-ACP methyl ester carboxylesterase